MCPGSSVSSVFCLTSRNILGQCNRPSRGVSLCSSVSIAATVWEPEASLPHEVLKIFVDWRFSTQMGLSPPAHTVSSDIKELLCPFKHFHGCVSDRRVSGEKFWISPPHILEGLYANFVLCLTVGETKRLKRLKILSY